MWRPFDVQSGVQSGIRIGECVFPLYARTAESFPEGSLSVDFPASIVPRDVHRRGNAAGTLKFGRKWIIVLAASSEEKLHRRCSPARYSRINRIDATATDRSTFNIQDKYI